MIKIASMVGAPDLQTPALAPYSGDFGTSCSKLSALGYDGIELMTKNPLRLDGKELCAQLVKHQLRLIAICTGHLFGEDQLGLVTPDLNVNPQAVERLKQFVDFAATLDPVPMINIGRSRGVGDPSRRAATLACAREALQELSDYALPKKIRFVLEPISKDEVNFIHTTRDGLDLAVLVDRPNIGLMLDTYHMYREDDDPIRRLREAAPYVWHIHISDSNRCYPGSADIPFEKFIGALQEIGYGGYVGLEIQPWPDPDLAARLSVEYLHRILGASHPAGGKHGY